MTLRDTEDAVEETISVAEVCASKRRTVPEVALFIADVVGLETGTMKHLARRLREGGYLSQFGHGRGAAEATAHDAATILLTAMTGVRPTHSPAAALALVESRRCVYANADGSYLDEPSKTFTNPAGDPISELASVLDGKIEINASQAGVDVHTRDGLRVRFFQGPDSVSYALDPSGAGAENLFEALGRKPVFGMTLHARCSGEALLEIAGWLKGAAG